MTERIEVGAIVQRLENNLAVFRGLTRGVGVEQARWKPDPASWSILEVVCHLADEDVEDFRARLDLALHAPGTPWPPIDPVGWVAERGYLDRDLEEAVAAFTAARHQSLRWLRALEDPDWSRTSTHPKLGPMSAGELLTSWLAHDFIHVRQLNRLHRQFLEARLSSYSPEYAGSW